MNEFFTDLKTDPNEEINRKLRDFFDGKIVQL